MRWPSKNLGKRTQYFSSKQQVTFLFLFLKKKLNEESSSAQTPEYPH